MNDETYVENKRRMKITHNFTPTEWSSAEDKEKFYNQFIKFVESDFDKSKFPKWFYERLSNCFRMIAHYNLQGFYSTFFGDLVGKIRFIDCCQSCGDYDDPKFTYCDAETQIKIWLTENNILKKLQKQYDEEFNAAELAEYQRLKKKFELNPVA